MTPFRAWEVPNVAAAPPPPPSPQPLYKTYIIFWSKDLAAHLESSKQKLLPLLSLSLREQNLATRSYPPPPLPPRPEATPKQKGKSCSILVPTWALECSHVATPAAELTLIRRCRRGRPRWWSSASRGLSSSRTGRCLSAFPGVV